MGILDGIVEWIAEQVMNALDLVTTSVLGALGCDISFGMYALRQSRDSGSRRIVLVDEPGQIPLLEFPGITGFCTVDGNGNVSYYKKST